MNSEEKMHVITVAKEIFMAQSGTGAKLNFSTEGTMKLQETFKDAFDFVHKTVLDAYQSMPQEKSTSG